MNPSQARRLFQQLAADFGDTDGDMVVDLMIGGDIEDDFLAPASNARPAFTNFDFGS
jgi:hypothetical protein